MTTIAFDGCTMACDSAFNGKSMTDVLLDDSKIRVGRDFLLGIAGDFARFKYFESRMLKESWKQTRADHLFDLPIETCEFLDADSIDLILATKDGVFEWHGPGIFLPTSHQPYAIGSGAAYAIGAMFQGATAKDAVKTAYNFDPHTNDSIGVFYAPWLSNDEVAEYKGEKIPF